MYGWIWRQLPGNVLVKSIVSLLLVLGIVYLLFQYVFPWAEPLLPFGEVTVNDGGPAAVQPSDSPSPAPRSSETALNGAAAPSAVVGTLSHRVLNPGAPQA
ncbi:hypothetical protein [Peterkaempfera bronchialis]|uniref:Uncharacterized protein n=1 Tax=Peterkaempfera bronchialis TaxID=2126346 RepID=A0A345SY34_9ACTN|nr:hypothetical protein [Peterkaempfera bronchialis]AXI78639.1 hypothetical protein C7M71_015590 [Peterkaempfera bronchialis]